MNTKDTMQALLESVAARYADSPAKKIVDTRPDGRGIDYNTIYASLRKHVSKKLTEAMKNGTKLNVKALTENIVDFLKDCMEGEGEDVNSFKHGDEKVDSLVEEIAARLDGEADNDADEDEEVVKLSAKKKKPSNPEEGEKEEESFNFEDFTENFEFDDDINVDDLFEDIDGLEVDEDPYSFLDDFEEDADDDFFSIDNDFELTEDVDDWPSFDDNDEDLLENIFEDTDEDPLFEAVVEDIENAKSESELNSLMEVALDLI